MNKYVQMDNLAADVKAAREAGMSYGMWKSLHPETKRENEAGGTAVAHSWKNRRLYSTTCLYCGKVFQTSCKQRKYCDDVCKNNQNNATYRHRHKKPAGNAQESEIELCIA